MIDYFGKNVNIIGATITKKRLLRPTRWIRSRAGWGIQAVGLPGSVRPTADHFKRMFLFTALFPLFMNTVFLRYFSIFLQFWPGLIFIRHLILSPTRLSEIFPSFDLTIDDFRSDSVLTDALPRGYFRHNWQDLSNHHSPPRLNRV